MPSVYTKLKPLIEEQPPALPANEDSERAVLGCILSPTKFAAEFFLQALDELDELGEEAFSLDSHRRIWRAMVTLTKANRPVDWVTVTEELMRATQDISIKAVGGHGYLDDLPTQYFNGMDIYYHLRHIKDMGIRRLAFHRLNAMTVLLTDIGTGLGYTLGKTAEMVASLRKLAGLEAA